MVAYTINQLYGEAYLEALKEVAVTVNETMGTSFFQMRDFNGIEMLADKLGVMFNENGEIIRSYKEV